MSQLQFRSDDTIQWQEGFGSRAEGDATPSGTFANANTSLTGTEGDSTAVVGANTGFAIGDIVALHQSRNGGDGAGVWQLNKIIGISGTTITFKYALTQDYATTGQMLRVAQNRNITITGTLTGSAWDGTKGGITFLMGESVAGTGTIDISGKGYRGGTINGSSSSGNQGEGTPGLGGQNSAANGNGGGSGTKNSQDSGNSGAGGGNGTAASDGPIHNEFGQHSGPPAVGGGVAGNAGLTVMVFGGGGSAGGRDSGGGGDTGNGGPGGGILIIIAKNIDLSAMTLVKSNGNNGTYEDSNHNGGGAGGAGGSIILKGEVINLGTGKVTATGGTGQWGCATQHSNLATNGGVGRVHIDYSATLTGTSNPTLTSTLDGTITDQSGGFFQLI